MFQPAPALSVYGFEEPNLGAGNWDAYRYNPTYDPVTQPWNFGGNSGVTGNNSGFTENNSNAAEGEQVAFVQMDVGVGSRSITLPVAGNYILVCGAAKRGDYNVAEQTVHVLLDENLFGSITPRLTGYRLLCFRSRSPAAGTTL